MLADSRLLAETPPQAWPALAERAAAMRDEGWENGVSFSRKVFIPLTQLCRDVCHYCTFAQTPRALQVPYLSSDRAVAIARAGARAGCREALFTLGDQPEARYPAAREALARLGHATTLDYLAAVAERVLAETGLLPHFNVGLLTGAEYAALRHCAPSFGIMLETSAERLSQRGGPHFGSPDKIPARRLEAIRLAGEAVIPLTSGILIGIGETRGERIEALEALRDLHARYGHIQEVIVQNFRAKGGTRMAGAPEPSMDDLCWTIAAARLILGPDMSIQAPPNLSTGALEKLVHAGINDWGGISPVTPDHVNPEAPWPEIEALREATMRGGKTLVERLTVYPRYIEARATWIDKRLHRHVLRHADAGGWARTGPWTAGSASGLADAGAPLLHLAPGDQVTQRTQQIVGAAIEGELPDENDLTTLFAARGADFRYIVQQADALRRTIAGNDIRFVVNRNINYTNVCRYACAFCAFSKGSKRSDRDGAYTVDLKEIRRRVREAWRRGATEVCLQGGIHPSYTGRTYVDILQAAKDACPQIHVHAFSPLEVQHGARSLGMTVAAFLAELKQAGLDSLPGTAAEILDDEIRTVICPDKLTTDEWLDVVGTAHGLGLPTTATILFGHIETYRHSARHLRRLAVLQRQTGGFTEFVPLPFVHTEAPLFVKSGSRTGPTLREAVMMHAISRLVFADLIRNIQTSWVKMGTDGARLCLDAGANDLGGTLMNESISRAAGSLARQELPPRAIGNLCEAIGRPSRQRTTLYGNVSSRRQAAALTAPPLTAPRSNPGARLPPVESALA